MDYAERVALQGLCAYVIWITNFDAITLPHLVEISVNGNTSLLCLSDIQRSFSHFKGTEVGEKKEVEMFLSNSKLKIETIVRNTAKDKKSIKIKIDGKSVIVTNQDFQKALTKLKQHRVEQLKKSQS